MKNMKSTLGFSAGIAALGLSAYLLRRSLAGHEPEVAPRSLGRRAKASRVTGDSSTSEAVAEGRIPPDVGILTLDEVEALQKSGS